MTRLALGTVWLLGLLFLVGPSQAADLEYATFRLSTTTGHAGGEALTSEAIGAAVLEHVELLNWGAPVEADGHSERRRYLALTLCGGVAALNDRAENNLVAPIGGCLVGYDLLSAGVHYDFQNSTRLYSLTLNPLTVPPALSGLFGRFFGSGAHP